MSDIDTSELRESVAWALIDHIHNGCTDPACKPGRAADEIPRSFIHHLAAEVVNALPALLDAADERDAAIAKVQRVEALADGWRCVDPAGHRHCKPAQLRAALNPTPTTSERGDR